MNEKHLLTSSKQAIIYTRVSTSEQAERGFSLARQKEECIQFAIKQGFEVVKVFEERGESAKTTDRTELQTMLQFCSQNKKILKALIVWKFDRLSRNVEDHYTLMKFFNKFSIDVLSATENNDNTATGKLTRNMLQAFSQFENDQKSERVIAGMKQALQEGKWLWRAPYGYKMINGDLYKDEETAPIVERIYTLFAKGLYTQNQVRILLEQENIIIKPSNLFNILRNSVYCGKICCFSLSEHIVKGNFEPIISEELFNKVQELLNGGLDITTSYTRNNSEYPLRQFVICPFCGQPLTASKSKGRKKRYAYYHCYNKNCKSQIRIPKTKLESLFVDYLKDVKPSYQNIKDFKHTVKNVYKECVKDSAKIVSKLTKELETLENKKNKLIDFYLDSKLSQVDFTNYSTKMDDEIMLLKSKISNSQLPDNDFEHCLNYVCNALEHIDEIWENSDIDTKQRIQQLVFPNGLVYENDSFRIISNDNEDTKKGALLTPNFKMVPPSEFESLSTP